MEKLFVRVSLGRSADSFVCSCTSYWYSYITYSYPIAADIPVR